MSEPRHLQFNSVDEAIADIEAIINGLRKLQTYPHSLVDMGPFGPVPIEEFRRLNLMHLAHHLHFLNPTSG